MTNKVKSLFLALLSLPIFMAAQNFSGVATYQSASQLDLKFDDGRMPPDRQKQIKERLSKATQKQFTLTFNKSQSLFKEIETLADQDERLAMMAMFMGVGGSTIYNNLESKFQKEQTEFFGKIFLISDSLDVKAWKLGKETKQIGSYTCYSATYQTKAFQKGFRPGQKEQKVDTSMVTVTAWYTPQIPVSHGPGSYWGLPGLIMEVSNETTSFFCTKIELQLDETIEIKEPKGGKKVSRSEFEQIVKDKTEEMAKMGRGPGRGPGGGRPGGGGPR